MNRPGTNDPRPRRASFQQFDWHVLLVAVFLAGIGVVFIWSTTHGDDGGRNVWARQVLYIGAVLPLVGVVVRMPYSFFARLAVPIYVIICGVLVFLLVRQTDEVRSTSSWIRLPMGFSLQPSEFAKVAVIIMLAAFLRFRERPKHLVDLVGPFALVGVPMLLVMKQPDLGSAVLMVPVLFAMLFSAGAKSRLLFGVAGAGALAALALYFSPFMHDYQRVRVQSHLESIPEKTREVQELRAAGKHDDAARADRILRMLKQGPKHQVYHAMISIGSGGLFGKGVGQGPHNRLDFLPERHNDFIFAVVGEEWGFLGSTALLVGYLLLIWLILQIARRTRDSFGRHLCVGVATMFGCQIFLNTGVATGLLPVTGVTLPFLSAGGSSIIASFLALAVVLSVGAHPVTVLDGRTFSEKAIGEI